MRPVNKLCDSGLIYGDAVRAITRHASRTAIISIIRSVNTLISMMVVMCDKVYTHSA